MIVWHAQEGKAKEILKTISKRQKPKTIGKQIKRGLGDLGGEERENKDGRKEKVFKRTESYRY